MAKLSLTEQLQSIAVSIESTDIDNLGGISVSDIMANQAQLMDDVTSKGIATAAKQLGASGCNCLNVWANDESLNARLPYMNSDGVSTILHWGDTKIKMSGNIESIGKVTGSDLAVIVSGSFGEYQGAILKIHFALQENISEDVLLECDTFEEVAAYLRTSIPYLSRKELMASDVAELTITSGELKTNKADEPYWEVIVDSSLGRTRISLPSEAVWAIGDVITVVRGDDPHLVLQGKELRSSGGWTKLHELELNRDYTCTQIVMGDYGLELVCPEIGSNITMNSHLKKWVKSLKSLDEVSPAKPLVIKVKSIKEIASGKKATLTLTHGVHNPLLSLINKTKSAPQSSTAVPTATPSASDKVEGAGGTTFDNIKF